MRLKISAFLLFIVLGSCSVQQKHVEQTSKEVQLPFNKKNYPDTNESFYVISNAIGTNLNTVKSLALADAQFNLSQRAISIIESHLNSELSNANELSKSKTRLNSVSKSNVFANQIALIDSKSFIKDNGKYEYWAVFSVDLDEVTKIINKKANLNLQKDFYKSAIDKDFQLSVKEKKNSREDEVSKSTLNESDLADKIITESKKYIGVPYVWGGENPETGFDCSGYVQWVLNESLGLYIPRTSKQQYNFFKSKIAKSLKTIKSGDILFFKTISSPVSHVGIAINNKSFIHAPNSDSKIRIDELEGYWTNRFVAGYAVNN